MFNNISDVINNNEVIKILEDLISIPSYKGIKNQETKVAEYIHELFQNEGIESEVIELEDGRSNIVARIRGNDNGKTLLYTGHMDTVPPYDMIDALTLKREGDKLIGRGTNDMKGPLACMIMAMIGIKRMNLELGGDLIFAGVADEEEKSIGTIDLIESGIKADGAIVGEPTNLDICTAHRGLEWIDFEFVGKTVHGGKQDEGINAVLKASNFIQELEKKLIPKLSERNHPTTGHSTMNYGTIHGGTQPSTVAGSCVLSIDRRWIPGEKYDDVLNEYVELIQEMSKNDPEFKCNIKVMDESKMKEGYVHEAMEIDQNHLLVNILKNSCEKIIRRTPENTYFPAWSDGGLLYRYGEIPTLVFAPGDLETAHSKDEFIDANQLMPAVKIYLQTAYEFCR